MVMAHSTVTWFIKGGRVSFYRLRAPSCQNHCILYGTREEQKLKSFSEWRNDFVVPNPTRRSVLMMSPPAKGYTLYYCA